MLSAVSMLADISSEMVYPLVPLYLSGVLGAPASIIGVIEGFAEAAASIFKWVFGTLSDRWGKRKPFCILGYGLAALTKPLLAIASAWPIVLCARVLDRLGKGMRGSPRDALIADSTPAQLRGRAFGFHRSGDSIGAVAGPMLALLFLKLLPDNYRAVFLIAFIPGLLSTLVLLPVREVAISAVHRPLFSLDIVKRNPPLRRFLFITLVFAIGNSSDMFLILRAKQLGADPATAVLLFALCNLLNVAVSYPAGTISDRIGRKKVLILGFFLFGAIYLAFGMASRLGTLWILFAAYGIYLGLTDGVSKALVVDLAGEERGAALGAQAAITGVAALPASIIAGLLWRGIGPPAAFVYGAATAALAGLLLLTSRPKAR